MQMEVGLEGNHQSPFEVHGPLAQSHQVRRRKGQAWQVVHRRLRPLLLGGLQRPTESLHLLLQLGEVEPKRRR